MEELEKYLPEYNYKLLEALELWKIEESSGIVLKPEGIRNKKIYFIQKMIAF